MKIFKSRLFKAIIIIFIVGLLCGFIGFIFLNNDYKKELSDSFNNYILLIKNSKFNYLNSFIKCTTSNYKYSFLLCVFGISFIFIILIPLFIFFSGIIFSFSLFSIIYTFKLKGLLYALILLFPSILNNFIYILISYYSINLGFKVFNAYKNNKNVNFKSFFRNYIFVFLILNICFIVTSLFETYISSNIIKFIV